MSPDTAMHSLRADSAKLTRQPPHIETLARLQEWQSQKQRDATEAHEARDKVKAGESRGLAFERLPVG